MTNWIIPANNKYYDLDQALLDNGFVDWSQNYNFNNGDIVYLYFAQPISKIKYVTRVVETNLSFENVADDEIYWLDKERYEKSKQNKFVKLKLIKKTNEKLLSFDLLKENGLLSNLQGGIRIDGKLLEYINNVVDNILMDDLNEIETYLEGKEQTVLVNKCERNPQARAKCLEHYGYSCQVCYKCQVKNGQKCAVKIPQFDSILTYL